MLKRAIIQTSTPMILDIENVNPDDILILTGISGLSRAGATLFTGEFAGEGGYYQGRRAKQRTPVFNFKINPDYKNDIEASDVREMLYRMFMEPHAESDAVQVLLEDDRRPDRYIRVYTEDIEADHFVKESKAMVSTFCTDAFLRSAEETVGITSSSGWLSVPIHYEGSADTGFDLAIRVLVYTEQIVIENNGKQMILDGVFTPGNVIFVGTNQGNRYIRKDANDIMVALRAGSEWLKLTQSLNNLRVYGETPGDGRVSVHEYRYRAAWWGL